VAALFTFEQNLIPEVSRFLIKGTVSFIQSCSRLFKKHKTKPSTRDGLSVKRDDVFYYFNFSLFDLLLRPVANLDSNTKHSALNQDKVVLPLFSLEIDLRAVTSGSES
jgi:hypothetical protein